jgi:5-methylcytosine-specific restriction enzyme subunit McrC
MSRISIRNLFAMLAYASYDAGLLDARTIGACAFERPLDLLARLLDGVLRRLHRRGIDRGYQEFLEVGPSPRGALEIGRTLAQLTHLRGALAYRFDELTADTAANRVLRASLRLLAGADQVAPDLRGALRAHLAGLHEVAELSALAALRLHAAAPRALPEYRVALRLARLALEQLLPDGGSGGAEAQALLRDPERLAELFEAFVRGFARFELRGVAEVEAKSLAWAAVSEDPRTLALLPRMRTDLLLRWRDGRVTIGECKFYERSLQASHRGTEERLRAGHLYQLSAYLRAAERLCGRRPEGLLLYAHAERELEEELRLEGYPLRVATIALDLPWPELRARLRRLLTGGEGPDPRG